MEYIFWAVILLLLIGTIVAAYFGSRVWHWAHVTLGVLIFLAAVGYFVLAAETLRINAVLRRQVNDLQQQVVEVDERIAALDRGTDDLQVIGRLIARDVAIPEDAESIPSLGDLHHALHLETRLRGRAWLDVTPAGFDPQTGTVEATIAAPQPPGISPDTILYLFEQGEASMPDPTQGAQYLGEFRVQGVTGQTVTLTSAHQLDDFERQRLAVSRGPWALYETMPVDRNELFEGLTEEQLRKWLPESTIHEYRRVGTEAGPDDDQWHRVGIDAEGNPVGPDEMDKAVKVVYQRRLRDYDMEFDELARRRVVLLADMAGVIKDNERLKVALDSARQIGAFREDEIRKLRTDLAGVTKEREIVESHLATVQTQLANARQALEQALAYNERMAERLAQLQAERRRRDGASAASGDGPLALNR